MNGNHENDNPSTWRAIGVPLLATVIAIMFWMQYYSSVGWWPFILFVIWVVQYTRYSSMRRGEKWD